jgi:hypothetical protein
MKQLSKLKKDSNTAHFSLANEKFLNRKRKKFVQNNEELTKKQETQSLKNMTKDVIKYIVQANSDYINLKAVAKDLKIQKRRLYDVINVLQGKYNLF